MTHNQRVARQDIRITRKVTQVRDKRIRQNCISRFRWFVRLLLKTM